MSASLACSGSARGNTQVSFVWRSHHPPWPIFLLPRRWSGQRRSHRRLSSGLSPDLQAVAGPVLANSGGRRPPPILRSDPERVTIVYGSGPALGFLIARMVCGGALNQASHRASKPRDDAVAEVLCCSMSSQQPSPGVDWQEPLIRCFATVSCAFGCADRTLYLRGSTEAPHPKR